MYCFLPLLVTLSAVFSTYRACTPQLTEIPIIMEWTCSGCWSTNPEEATHCSKCGRPKQKNNFFFYKYL